MIFLVFSILSSTGIFIIFKTINNQNRSIFITIVVNYIVATLTGLIINYSQATHEVFEVGSWLYFAIFMGILFISNFFIMGISIHRSGITPTSIATKMSVVIPVIFSVIFYKENMGVLKSVAIITALLAVFLTIIKKSDSRKFTLKYAFYPIFLFIGSGLVDSFIKYIQVGFVNEGNTAVFSSAVFGFAAIIGLFALIIRYNKFKKFFSKKVLVLGVLLGLLNFCALYSIIKALEVSGLDSSLVFMINSLAVVCLSIIISLIIYREKLGMLNWIGICLSIIVIFILANI